MSAPAYMKRGNVPLQDSGAAMGNLNPMSAAGQPANPYFTFTAASPNAHQNPQLPMPARKRIWVKRPGGNATTLFVGPGDLVDDVKSQIMLKFPTTLAQQFDPSELILKLEVPSVSSPSAAAFSVPSSHTQRDPTYQSSPLTAQNATFAPKTIMSRSSSTNLQGNKMSKMRPHAAAGENPSHHAHPVSPIPVSASKSSLLNHSDVSATDRVPETAHRPSPLGHTKAHTKPRTTTIVLEPDAFIWKILEQYFPSGMKLEDSFIIDTPYPVAEKRSSVKTTAFPQVAETSFFNQTSAGASFSSEVKDAANAPPFYSGSLTGRSNPTKTPQDAVFTDNNYSGKVAVLGEQGLPPPREFTRLGRSSVQDQNQSSSTVILFPKGTRTGSKSPASQYSNHVSTPGRTPTFEETHAADETNKASGTPESASSSSKHSILLKHGPKKEEVASALRLKQQPKPGINKILTNINVLVVEDNLVNQKILARHLKSCNVQFKIASNGEEGLQLWKEGGFHLCFMDIQLPVISGIQVTEEIRRLERLNRIGNFANLSLPTEQEELKPADQLDHELFRSPIIIVALTASTSAADKQQALAAGCNDYLTKPVQLKWLRNKLTEWGCMQALINYDHFRNGKD
ncbi:hypothetical protein KL935_003783 [Ogataea polymorpha]|uniref:uncharacterized protein n=1 Tax=Ogataea polymorpha TaxID=460523 RepID=UPI0007F40522|nr:uncharacterized protein OGAPODRAFT_95870 [Ogataea polymorpha]KAG7892215.1 hypothetical protein KL908_003820 [Ogataea polymorpha]KAG7899473.1 hypothetical protein KL935_003783 [Ogataea polymorpha]KAG7907536.1 hypothetical protein KL906_003617 [Ogataea polymorpha]KAG7932966.1 hypothetical protein KL934_003621 [Ogataea polymorpha]OBA13720.1 hypothetical protein OGAPODRAFT_95870 [Ogataea polymorpha]